MDLKERIDINITDLVNRIDRLTSGNVGHSKNQLRFQIKKVGEFVNELCESQKSNTGDRQLTIPVVNQQSELLAIEALKKITKAHSETYSKQVAVEALKAIANCG